MSLDEKLVVEGDDEELVVDAGHDSEQDVEQMEEEEDAVAEDARHGLDVQEEEESLVLSSKWKTRKALERNSRLKDWKNRPPTSCVWAEVHTKGHKYVLLQGQKQDVDEAFDEDGEGIHRSLDEKEEGGVHTVVQDGVLYDVQSLIKQEEEEPASKFGTSTLIELKAESDETSGMKESEAGCG